MRLPRPIHPLIVPLLTALVLCTACTKNELTLSGTLRDGASHSLLIVYRAADKEKSYLVEEDMKLTSAGEFTLTAQTRYPTVIWIFSETGDMMMPIYAERGDELTLSGTYGEPYTWTVKGNEVMEQYSEWLHANEGPLRSGSVPSINKAVSQYVSKHPDSLCSAMLLYVHFTTRGHEDEFASLLKRLKIDDEELEYMRLACISMPVSTDNTTESISEITLPSIEGNISNIKAAHPGGTLLYFWRTSPDTDARALLSAALQDSLRQTVSIYMDTDTVSWHHSAAHDNALSRTTNLWALGGEANKELQRLGVKGDPYFIVASPTGKMLYTGSDPNAARAALK